MTALRGRAILVRILALSFAFALALPGTHAQDSESLRCQRHFEGIEYCTADDGQTHIVTIDLAEPSVQFDLATASNATGPNPPSWSASMRQTVAQMARAHPTLDELPLAVAINGDYFAADASHGWEGFAVQRGERRDGPGTNTPDCDCTSFDRSSLTFSKSKPTLAEIARRTPAELNQFELYQSVCARSSAFAGCQATVLNRTPTDGEAQRLEEALKDRWYTAVGGGPAIVQDGKAVPISQACQGEKFTGDWCQDNPQTSPDRMRQLRMGTMAGITANGKQLILIVTTARLPNELSQMLVEQGVYTGIRFDGSESSQMVYNAEEKTGNTRGVANALLVYASPLPADAASLAEPVWPIIALPEETVQAKIVLLNEGLATWRNADGYALVNVRDPLGALLLLSLPHDVAPGETATWTLNMIAPERAGITRSAWELAHAGKPVEDRVTVWVGVLPEQAAKWKAELEELIADAKQKWEEAKEQGEAEKDRIIEELTDELERRLLEIIEQAIGGICPCAGPLSLGTLMLAAVLFVQRRK